MEGPCTIPDPPLRLAPADSFNPARVYLFTTTTYYIQIVSVCILSTSKEVVRDWWKGKHRQYLTRM